MMDKKIYKLFSQNTFFMNLNQLMCDSKIGKTIDIVCTRKLKSLMNYFSYFTHKVGINVKLIVIDMYLSYIKHIIKSTT